MMQQFVIDGVIYEEAGNGQVRVVGYADQPPVDPEFQYKAPQAGANVEKTVTDIQDTRADNARDDQRLAADLFERGLRIGANGQIEAIPGWTPPPAARTKPEYVKEGKAVSDNVRAATEMLRIIDGEGGLQEQFDSNFSGGGIADALGEYSYFGLNPTAEQFASKANSALPYVKKFMRTPGEGAQSDRDAQVFKDLLPTANARDATNQQRIDDMRQAALSVLEQEGAAPPPFVRLKPASQIPGLPEQNITAGQAGEKFLTDRDREIGASINRMIASGATLDQINAALQSLGRGPIEGVTTQEDFERRRAMGNLTFTPSPTGTRTQTQETLGAVATNPGFTAGASAVDALGMGTISAIAGDRLDAIEQANPTSAMLGQIAGSMGGTALVGAAGRNTIGRALPRLMANSGRARFGRNLAADAAYGGIYGQNAEGDALGGVLEGTVGSIGGQALGKGIGTLAAGANISPAVARLRNSGVGMTTGRMLGGVPARIEDAMQSFPVVGDMIRRRQTDSFNDFNQAAFRQAGEPIGFTPQATGYQGLQDFEQAVGKAYDDATAGKVAQFDQQFLDQFGQATQSAQALPADLRRNLGEVLNARVAPLTDTGQMTGEQFQQAQRALKATRSNPPQRFQGFEQDYRDAVSGVMDALNEQMGRADPEVVPKLNAANNAYRGLKTIENAAERAKGGTQSGELYAFTPSQLQMAIQASGRKFPGEQPLRELADAGQEVLPSTLPNSGTTDRALLAGAGLSALGVGGGTEYSMTGEMDNTAKIAAALAILTAGGTKAGQKMLTGFLDPANRPDKAIAAREMLRRRLRKGGSGLFGSAGAGLALASGS